MSCKCKICSRHKKVEEIIKSRNVDELIKLVRKFEDDNLHLADDLDYYLAILEGSWPSSVKILTAALKKAKEHVNKATKSS